MKQIPSVKEVVEEFADKFVDHIKTVEIGQYNDKGVNIGFKTAYNLMKEALTQTLQAERKKREEMMKEERGLLNFVWTKSDNFVYEAGSDGTQTSYWHCKGCKGEFVSRWPRWEEPTEETFPHEKECPVLKVIQAITHPNNPK